MCYLQSRDVVVGHELKPGHERSEPLIAAGVSGAGNGRHGTTPEIPLYGEKTLLIHAESSITPSVAYKYKCIYLLFIYLLKISYWSALN